MSGTPAKWLGCGEEELHRHVVADDQIGFEGGGREGAKSFGEYIVEGGGGEATAGFGAPSQAFIFGNLLPRVSKAAFGENIDDVALRKLAIVVGIKITAREPAANGLFAVGYGHGFDMAEELFGLLVPHGPHVFRAFWGVAASVRLQVIAIHHDEAFTVRIFEGGEGKAAGHVGDIGFPRFPPRPLTFQFRGDADLLRTDFPGLRIDEAANHMNGESGDDGTHFMEGIPVVDLDADEDVRIHGFQGVLPCFHVGRSLCGGGGGALAREPF